jgi:hypothetical protein
MNLAKPTNSLQSNIMHASVNGAPAPEVGMGVTILMWTDRHVGTITKVVSDSEIHFTEDTTVADKSKGELQMGHQDWIHTPNPNGPVIVGKKGRDGKWYRAHKTATGRWSVSKSCTPLAVGFKNYNYDWSF